MISLEPYGVFGGQNDTLINNNNNNSYNSYNNDYNRYNSNNNNNNNSDNNKYGSQKPSESPTSPAAGQGPSRVARADSDSVSHGHWHAGHPSHHASA